MNISVLYLFAGEFALHKKTIERRTSWQLVPLLYDGPALISDQYDLLDALVVLVVQPIRDGLFQICCHIRVALIQEGVDGLYICKPHTHTETVQSLTFTINRSGCLHAGSFISCHVNPVTVTWEDGGDR